MGSSVISTSIPNLINGISQQPAALRNPSQGEVQINAFPSVVEGLTKRPPTQHVTKVQTGTLGAAHIHTINRDTNERYQVVITNGDLAVYDLDGTSKTVNFPDGKGYLTATDPVNNFKALTVADFTFIANNSVTAAMETTLSTSRGSEALVFVKVANYETDYFVDIDGYEKASYSTGSSGALKTTTIADDLVSDLTSQLNPTAWAISTAYAVDALRENGGNAYICTTAGTSAGSGGPTGTGTGISDGSAVWDYHGPTGFTVEQSSSTIWIVKDDATTFDCQIRDSRSNSQMRVATDVVQRFSDLPTIAPDGYILEVKGDNTSSFDNYYVKFETNNDNSTFDEGVWVETVAPGIEYQLNGATLPHQLVREPGGDFTFQEVTWGDRTVGDLNSSPNPSFIGNTINDVFFEDNRLSFLSDDNVIQSRAGEFFTFFVSTVTTVVESDVIDTAASHTKVSILNHAVPFNEQVLLFSDQTQFSLEKNDSTGLKEVKVLTEFESASGVRPVGAGRTVYFVTDKGSYSGVREYFSMGDGADNDAADITAHVPKYLPSGVFKLAVATNEDILVALSSTYPNRVFVYKYYWTGNEKLQSAWNYFEFSDNAVILNVDFIGTDAYFLVQYADAVYLEKMGVEPGRVDPYGDLEFLLDRKVSNANADVSVVYDAGTNTTTWTLQYSSDGDMVAVVRPYTSPETTTLPVGTKLQTGGTGVSVTATGDYSTTPVWLGQTYNMTYRFSSPTLKENSGDGKAVVSAGRLQIKFWELQYDTSGYFTAECTPTGRSTQTYKYTGNILGATSAVIGEATLGSGVFRFPVMSKSDRFVLELKNDSFLPCRFVSAGWEGMYSRRSRRV